MTHDEVKELIPAYALDAVGSMDRTQIDDHLETCDQCRAALRDHREAAGLLAFSTEPSIPSKGLRTRLMSEASVEENGSQHTGAKAATAPAGRRGLILLIVAVVGVTIAAILVLPRRFAPSQAVFTPEILKVLAAESLTSELLRPTRELPEASGQVFDPGEGDSIVVAMRGLKDPADRVYMLWVVVRGSVVPLGQVEIDQEGSALYLVKSLPRENDGLVLTLEESAETRTLKGVVILESVRLTSQR